MNATGAKVGLIACALLGLALAAGFVLEVFLNFSIFP
jgi:hypothetical protein